MAKPANKPLIATSDVNLPSTGQPNKSQPNTTLQTVGYDKGQKPAAEEYNWLWDNVVDWVNHFETITDDALLGANNLSDVDSALTSFNNIKQVASTTYNGVVELATQAEVDAGTDTTTAVTPATLAGMRSANTPLTDNLGAVSKVADISQPSQGPKLDLVYLLQSTRLDHDVVTLVKVAVINQSGTLVANITNISLGDADPDEEAQLVYKASGSNLELYIQDADPGTTGHQWSITELSRNGGGGTATITYSSAQPWTDVAGLTVGSVSGTQVLLQNGYKVLPGGLIMQWGIAGGINLNTSSWTDSPTPFPLAFPNNVFMVSGSITNDQSSGDPIGPDPGLAVREKIGDLTTFQYWSETLQSGAQIAFIAIGN